MTIDLNNFNAVTNEHGRHPEKTSEKYRFIPTTRALTVLADYGWFPSIVRQANVLDPANRGYQRHLIRLRNREFERSFAAKGAQPEITLVNSHRGDSSHWFYSGMTELVCMNALLADGTSAMVQRVPHIGYTDQKVEAAIKSVINYFEPAFAARERWMSLTIQEADRIAYAEAAALLRWGKEDGPKVEPRDLLTLRHPEQAAPTLWNTYNTVQEAIIKGGTPLVLSNGTRSTSRRMNNLRDEVRFNQKLWQLAESLEARVQ